MSRINEDWEPDCVEDELRAWAFQGNCRRALAGKKGRKFLQELEAALLALPMKRLAHGVIASSEEERIPEKVLVATGDVCALGAVAAAREEAAGVPRIEALSKLAKKFDPEEDEWAQTTEAAHHLKICHPLAYEIVFENDRARRETPEQRYERVLAWVREQLGKAKV